MSNPTPFKKATLDDWHKAAVKSAPGGDVGALNWVTPDGITVKPLYTAADTQGLPHADTLPGFEPFLRGPTPVFQPPKNPMPFIARPWPLAGRAYRWPLIWPPTGATTRITHA